MAGLSTLRLGVNLGFVVALRQVFVEVEVSIRKVLRPATSTQVFLGFPVSTSDCSDGSPVSKLLLHASHVALLT